MTGPKRIVVGVDGSKAARIALAWGLEEARLRQATCVLVHAYIEHGSVANPFGEPHVREDEESARALLAAEVAFAEESGVPFEAKLVVGHAAQSLIEEAAGAEGLVVGSRGHGALIGALLGSVSSICAHHAPCPVTIIPPDLGAQEGASDAPTID